MDMDEQLAEYEKSLGLPPGFINLLAREGDDWSFVIKAHALVETGLTELLTLHLAKPALDEMLVRLPITGQFSKIEMSKALQLLGEDGVSERFIVALGTIRNRVAHNIKRVNFSFVDYFQTLSKESPDAFMQQHRALDLIFAERESVEVNGVKVKSADLFKDNARVIISGGLRMVLTRIHFLTGAAKVFQKIQENTDRIVAAMLVSELKASQPTETEPFKT